MKISISDMFSELAKKTRDDTIATKQYQCSTDFEIVHLKIEIKVNTD